MTDRWLCTPNLFCPEQTYVPPSSADACNIFNSFPDTTWLCDNHPYGLLHKILGAGFPVTLHWMTSVPPSVIVANFGSIDNFGENPGSLIVNKKQNFCRI